MFFSFVFLFFFLVGGWGWEWGWGCICFLYEQQYHEKCWWITNLWHTLTGNLAENSCCHVLASCSFGQSARSIESRCVVIQITNKNLATIFILMCEHPCRITWIAMSKRQNTQLPTVCLIYMIFVVKIRNLSHFLVKFCIHPGDQTWASSFYHHSYTTRVTCIVQPAHWPAHRAGLLFWNFFYMLTPVPYHHFFSSLILLFIYV